ncbi:hypothetical protein A8924_3638 [Saccharopolyspora erythraea NRRL 2338]|uniref:Uncharacterized protein n=2 Tax=Saccharopolyspora erythraea TaxID=1836 RepID=A4FEP6_SACEN|nr:hypothetical protein [Saccharopolyspora erythraea]EQD83200.1 hypothetical protein N599_26530 [Saccharopolyspora erythraea D]PFG96246.1 hypothetical protein A8924_3638 [Saccharopolyspora erythraea NRRL 2338]QRK92769.1 hypothetical protein JQX30_16630 [Saccharopolyspora erythraea]CAM02521.1 hypothetical protein SACE_3246 [Saccharopolyspora erythraea NRRL 2338]
MLPVDDGVGHQRGEAKQRFPDVDPHVLDPMVEWLESPEAPAEMRWKLLQRGLWVHGVATLFDYMRARVSLPPPTLLSRVHRSLQC